MEKNIVWHNGKIDKKNREELLKQKGVVLWFTGYSGSGKSSLASELEKKLYDLNYATYILDGDNIRFGLNKDLDFSKKARQENIRRIGEVAKLFADSGLITISSFISPFIKGREFVRQLLNKGEFIEIYVKCSLEECEKRDVKGLYKKARAGEIKNFTGIASAYEEPKNPELILDTENNNLEKLIEELISYLKEKNILK